MNYSLTISGLLIMIIAGIIKWSGQSVDESAIRSFIEVAIVIIGVITTYIGRYRQGDITWFGSKKK